MFSLEIPTDKLEKFDKLMNKANIVYRVDESNKNPAIVVIKLKNQEKFDKTKEVVKNL